MNAKQKGNEEQMEKAITALQSIADSTTTPRNIRKIVKDSITTLNESGISLAVKAANAISMLDEISQDPNMPSFARVTVWSAVSILESIRE